MFSSSRVMTDALTEHAEFPLGPPLAGQVSRGLEGSKRLVKGLGGKSLRGFSYIGQDHLLYKATCRSHKHKPKGPKRRGSRAQRHACRRIRERCRAM
jgi:hypothetical protein